MLKMMAVFLAGKIFKSAIETGNPYFLMVASFVLFIVFVTDAYYKIN